MPAGAAGGIFQQIGYLFSAEDLASPAVRRAEAAVEASTAGIESSLTSFSGIAQKITFVVGSLGVGLEHTGEALAGFGNIGKIAGGLLSGVGKSLGGGGLMGFILGPIAPLLGLLTPLINVITKTLQPAFDVLGGAVENAFAPFSFIAETVAQSLVPLIQTFMKPFVSLLSQGAIQLGVFLQGFAQTGNVVGPLQGIMKTLQPAFERLVSSATNLVTKLLPVVSRTLQVLLPIGTKLVEIFITQLADRLDFFADLAAEVLPDLVGAIGELLTAVMPLIEVMAKLGSVLLKEVFTPLLIIAIKGITEGITLLAKFLTAEVIPVVVPFITDVTKSVADFFGNLGKYIQQFQVLFKPEIDMVKDAFEGLHVAFGPIFTDIASGFKQLYEGIRPVIDGIKTLMNLMPHAAEKTQAQIGAAQVAAQGVGFNQAEATRASGHEAGIQREVARRLAAGESIADLQAASRGVKIPKQAEGGIAVDDTVARIGEAGPEAILPLRADVIRAKLAPALAPILELHGLQDAVTILRDIHSTIRDGLGRTFAMMQKEQGEDTGRQAPAGRDNDEPGGSGLVGLMA